jgi:hypothetical protein
MPIAEEINVKVEEKVKKEKKSKKGPYEVVEEI